jgi:hypothetical protein
MLTVRVEPRTKTALTAAANSERRSLANMLEVMVLAWCRDHDIDSQSSETEKPR